MKKLFSLLVSSIAIALCVILNPNAKAENVTQKQALQIAQTFFNASYGEVVSAPKMVWNGRQFTTDRLFSPFYIYNHPKGGFVIIAADSKAFPIIGYSRNGKFERDKLTEKENELLQKYAREIEMIRYDSRIPERAIEGWQNLALYINKILKNPYDTPEFEALDEVQRENLEEIDRRNNSIMLPSAVEFDIYNPDRYRDYTLDDVLVSAEDIPFKFYEDFIEEITREQQARLAAFDEIISPSKPTVIYSGGAHYTIRFPSEIKLIRIYNMQGARMMERYFNDTDVVNLDISALPVGFYAMLALGDDGHVYGLKIFR